MEKHSPLFLNMTPPPLANLSTGGLRETLVFCEQAKVEQEPVWGYNQQH
jgi:hypothetical protein